MEEEAKETKEEEKIEEVKEEKKNSVKEEFLGIYFPLIEELMQGRGRIMTAESLLYKQAGRMDKDFINTVSSLANIYILQELRNIRKLLREIKVNNTTKKKVNK